MSVASANATRTARSTQPCRHAHGWTEPRAEVPRVAVVIPAHNEEAVIADTVRAAVGQDFPVSAVIVVADNCTDATAEVARSFAGVRVLETENNRDKKPGALNLVWRLYGGSTDYFACIDADTILPPESVRHWVRQAEDEPDVGGISARFTMLPRAENSRWGNFLTRLQKAEFARWTDTALKRGGETSVLAGTACLLRVAALTDVFDDRVISEERADGPWSTTSTVEDFELTYRLRRLGYHTRVSFTVRAYTDAMKTLPTLWSQRMKWQTGTVEDLLRLGVNRYTLRDWGQQALGMLAAFVRVAWLLSMALAAALGALHVASLWFLIPVLYVVADVKHATRVPHRDAYDLLLAALLVPQELFAWLRGAWFTVSWCEVLVAKMAGRRKDRWALQIASELRQVS